MMTFALAEPLCVVTNNPRIAGRDVRHVEGSPLDVLEAVERLLQSGYSLVSAPLPPNIPLMRAPYRSLLLERSSRRYDVEGLRSIAAARERFMTQRAISGSVAGTDDDFADIDGRLLQRALRDYEPENSTIS